MHWGLLGMCYGCIGDCQECVMDALGIVRNVLWMHWGLLGMCYGCMRDGWMMGILYLLCKLYCEWYCNCDIVVCDIIVMLIFVFCFSGLFIWPIKYNPNDGVCVLSTAHPNPQQWRPMRLGVWSWCRVSVGSSADRLQTSDGKQWCVSGPPGCPKYSTQQTAVTAPPGNLQWIN